MIPALFNSRFAQTMKFQTYGPDLVSPYTVSILGEYVCLQRRSMEYIDENGAVKTLTRSDVCIAYYTINTFVRQIRCKLEKRAAASAMYNLPITPRVGP